MKRGLIAVAVVVTAIQFYRPDRTLPPRSPEKDFLVCEDAPAQIAASFKKACYDCHSNHTRYRWYDYIAPVSWIVDRNIRRARRSLNFSEWGDFEPWRRRIFVQGGIGYDLKIGRMPPADYLLMHPDARLTKQEKREIGAWLGDLDMR